MPVRSVISTSKAKPTIEGAGVNLHRAFGFYDPEKFDPFLLFDDFRNDNPADYHAGFPWHPHRGIETITYVLNGTVDHADSLGNSGTLGAGSVQWMTAGSGILHQEMPKGDQIGKMHGFQLWANLPSSLKMTAPRYQDIAGTDIPEVIDDETGENFYFEIGSDLESFEYTDEELASIQAIYQPNGAWIAHLPSRITEGSVSGERISSSKWEISVDVVVGPFFEGGQTRNLTFKQIFTKI